MSDAGRLAVFALVLVLALLAGLGIGAAVGPLRSAPDVHAAGSTTSAAARQTTNVEVAL
ncbi:hypothetical protein [Cellulomonas sp. SG140]|uniref:hypothetical protein n=1 Tax=Cellulomonas sp. SG140 TaxID=2976536 RepID=UPI0021E8458E|nr:hypothetical protein [Cellulomonas sp. SG140]